MLAAVRIVVGPGMPGRRFEGSRHNIGYGVVDRLAARRGIAVDQSTHGALLGSVSRIATGDWVLGDPTAGHTATLGSACDVAALAVEIVLDEGPVRALNRINQREEVHGGSPL
jgi:peptidyl-tRNA hydrolase